MGNALLGKNLEYPLNLLKKHFIALGSTGCGKTVLTKALVEESIINNIPCILVDPQGDLASLAIPISKENAKENNVDLKRAEAYSKIARVVVFTPTSSKGIPICVNPLKLPKKGIEKEDLISIISQISDSITELIGYKLDNDKGKNAQSLIYLLLMDCWKKGISLKTFDELSSLALNIPQTVQKEGEAFIKDKKELEVLAKKLKYLTIGNKELLFQFGVPLDIDILLGKGQQGTQLSIIYLNTLESMEEKQFFVSMLATELYQWMLSNPSKELQAVFMIDEISPFIPAGASKPMAKEILRLIFKQARKFGIGCVVCTQNPGDIDYKAFAQFGTWAIGRMTVSQDVKKVEMALKSLAAKGISSIVHKIPQLKPGNFMLFCPDAFKDIKDFGVRWLLTEHKTLTDDDIKDITPKEIRAMYDKLSVTKPEKQEEFVEELIEEKPVQLKEGLDHFPVNIGKEEITKTVEQKKKQMFVLFGPATESVESLSLILKPLIRVKIIKKEKGVFKDKTKEHVIYFDGVTGDIVKFGSDGSLVKSFSGVTSLLGLSEREISVFREIANSKGLTNAEVAINLKLDSSFISQVTNMLMKRKVIDHVEKAGKSFLWQPLLNVNIPFTLASAESGEISLEKGKLEGKKVQITVNPSALSKLVRAWFNASIAEETVVYYPYYEVKYAGKGGKRALKLSAVNRRTIEW